MLNVHDHQFSYLELLAKGIRPEKEIKEMQIRKKTNRIIFFSGGIIIYLQNLSESTTKILELIMEFGKVERCKDNM